MSKDSSFLVYIPGACTLEDAERALVAAKLGVTRDGDTLAVRMGTGPTLFVGLNAEPWVVLEATELSEDSETPEIAECTRRFEVAIEDLEQALDEYNTLFEVQAVLQDLTHGWVLLSWNGELMAPE
ncbi:MAG: hypothetical protein U0263_40820 [Polyangiaceae bacterium]